MKKRSVWGACAVMAIVATAALAAQSINDENSGRQPYDIGLWGDLPYSTLQATVGVPNLIDDINGQRLAFTVNDGDLKAGSGPCTNDVYERALGYFNALRSPAAFTPGDNDWVDCDRNPGVSSLERLDFERSFFFNTTYTMGQRRLLQDVQTDALCLGVSGQVPCVENRRWTYGGVTYVTLNVQGSCNNLCDTLPDPVEFNARNHANIVWLQQTFALAKAMNSVAVMVIAQADPGFDTSGAAGAPLRNSKTLAETDGLPDGFVTFLSALRDEVIAFRKPVVYVHGDSHYFRLDKPLLDSLGRRLENFTRLETFGDNQANGNNDVNWVKVSIDPRDREVFSFQPRIVPANRTAVPAP